MATLSTSILGVRGIHWLATRFGNSRLRSLSFDEKFKRGDWNFTTETPDLVRLVEQYCLKGHVLVLGCGSAPIASALNPDLYDTFTGVDLSTEAIAIAGVQAGAKIRFEVADMVRYQCSRRYNVILFPDSLYYIYSLDRKKLLTRMCQSLTPDGRIIVVIAHPRRYASILELIRSNFVVEVDRTLEGTQRHVLVFSESAAA